MGECLCQPPCSCCSHLVPSEVLSGESGVDGQCLCQPPCSFIPNLVAFEVQSCESRVDGQCLCQPPGSFIPHLVISDVQSGESGVVVGEPADSLIQLGDCGSHCLVEGKAEDAENKEHRDKPETLDV